MPYSTEWWLERLQRTKTTSDGWMAECPAHNDPKQSLHISMDEEGMALVHCFAGCEYQDILSKIEEKPVNTISTTPIQITRVNLEAGDWWERYTGVPRFEWETWGVTFDSQGVVFSWPNSIVRKKRLTGKKMFVWDPEGYPAPPLWPSIPDTLPETIWLTEGESDLGVLRHLKIEGYALTKGAGVKNIHDIWTALKERGVRKVVLTFDRDPGGERGALYFSTTARESGISASILNMRKLIDPLRGEKDLRDVWLSCRDVSTLRRSLETLSQEILSQTSRSSRMDLLTFMGTSVETETWLVDNIWLTQTVGMIAGSPKMGKTWLALDLAISVATGTPFLGEFEVNHPGPVVLLTKEDPDYLLQDRLAKILQAKGLGGTITPSGRALNIRFPEKKVYPLYLDLKRSFLFNDRESLDLMIWLREIREVHGYISLVIFDPILRMLSEVDEYKASEINTAIFSITSKIQNELRSGVVLVHHKGKGTSEGKGSYGSVAFHAFSENTLYIQGDEPDPDGWIRVRGEYKSARETSWSYKLANLETKYDVQINRDPLVTFVSKTGATKSVLDLLKELYPGGLTIDEILERVPGPSEYIVRESLRQLEGQKKVQRVKVTVTVEGSKGGPRRDKWCYLSPVT